MPFAAVNGNQIYFEDSGGDGLPVVFSHGFTLNHSMWDGVVAEMGDEYRCITWDSRGHGMSGVADIHREWDLADDVAGLLDHLGIDKAAAVGLSQGGFTTFRFGLSHPDRALAVVPVDTSAEGADPIEPHREMAQAWVENGPIGELIEGFAVYQFGTEFDPSSWIRYWQGRPPEAWRTPWESILGQDSVLDRLGEISCPSLVIHGSNDLAFSAADAEKSAKNLPDNRGIVIIEGAPHVSAVTHPVEVATALKDFFEGAGLLSG